MINIRSRLNYVFYPNLWNIFWNYVQLAFFALFIIHILCFIPLAEEYDGINYLYFFVEFPFF